MHTMHISMIGRQATSFTSFQNSADPIHSGESLFDEHSLHIPVAVSTNNHDAKSTTFPASNSQASRSVNPSLLESCVDLRALEDTREDTPEHDIDATIASLETQVDALCSLLDTFRSDFQSKLQAFRDDIRTLPDRVGVAYSPRQRAHLLGMYGKSIAESGELALHKLQHDLAYLVSLEGDARPYEEYCSTASSSFVSARSGVDSIDVLPAQELGVRIKPRSFAALLRAATLPILAPMAANAPDLSAAEAAPTEHNEHSPNDREEEEEQHPPPIHENPAPITLRPHREAIIDWDRFCGDCPARAESKSYCKGCSGWRRGFEDPTWDGRGEVGSFYGRDVGW